MSDNITPENQLQEMGEVAQDNPTIEQPRVTRARGKQPVRDAPLPVPGQVAEEQTAGNEGQPPLAAAASSSARQRFDERSGLLQAMNSMIDLMAANQQHQIETQTYQNQAMAELLGKRVRHEDNESGDNSVTNEDGSANPPRKYTKREEERLRLNAYSSTRPQVPSPPYDGKHLHSYRTYMEQCENAFLLIGKDFMDDERKIAFAVQALSVTMHRIWSSEHADLRSRNEPPTWEYYQKFLLDRVDNPAVRATTAHKTWETAKLKPGQSIDSFVTYLRTLEAEFERPSEQILCMTLLNKIPASVRKMIKHVHGTPANRAQLVEWISRHQAVEEEDPQSEKEGKGKKPKGKGRDKNNKGSKNRDDNDDDDDDKDRKSSKDNKRGGGRGRGRGRGRGGRDSRGEGRKDSSSKRDKSTVECHACHEMGHYAPECPNKDKKDKDKSEKKDKDKKSGSGKD